MADPYLRASFELHFTGFMLQPEIFADSEVVVIFGPSGAGKSLTLRALAGLVAPLRGFIALGDRTLFDSERGINLPPQDRKVGYVPQNFALFPHRTIAQNIGYGLHDLSRPQREERIQELLVTMSLEDQGSRKPGAVSGGQQQRAALARALAARPELLLMDEPFGALEEELRVHLRQEIRQAQRRSGIPVVLVTHNLAEAYNLADLLIVIDEGKVIQSGARDDVFRRPIHPKVARMMGMLNILETRVIDAQRGRASVEWFGNEVVVEGEGLHESEGKLTLGIRPEEITILPPAEALEVDRNTNLFKGILVEDIPQGLDHLLTFQIHNTEGGRARLIVRVPHPEFITKNITQNEFCWLIVEPSEIHTFLPNSSPSNPP
jgi:molybdate transport system ATP-binding protein